MPWQSASQRERAIDATKVDAPSQVNVLVCGGYDGTCRTIRRQTSFVDLVGLTSDWTALAIKVIGVGVWALDAEISTILT